MLSIGVLALVTLVSFDASAQGEQATQPGATGYYYYPQPTYYAPYAGYGYQPPGYAPPAAAPVVAPDPAPASAPTVASPEIEIDATRYPVIESRSIEATDGVSIAESRLGPVLAGDDGRTLYVAFREPERAGRCGARCATLWRPYLVGESENPGEAFSVVTHAAGQSQWSYQGRGLYQWIGDRETGEVTGDGVDGLWFAVRVRRG